jgi:predicted cupin superfamily sugar epimerase
MNTPEILIRELSMIAHPEGGHYVETYRADDTSASLIFYLLQHGERSHWHRLTKDEILHFYDGEPMRLNLSEDGENTREVLLGRDLQNDERMHAVVAKGTWFSMQSSGAWSLIGCTVSPAFSFDDFELAQEDWTPKAYES